MKLSKLVITGCDSKSSWMLPWFKENYSKHNDIPLHVFNFDDYDQEGWFNKTAVMLEASKMADQVVWLDTDCEVRADISKIFNYIEPTRISMCVDQPWTRRRGERGTWFNSGVVGFSGISPILSEWNRYITDKLTNEVGDQEVLNWMLGGDTLRELTHIRELPNTFNFLRLQIQDKDPGYTMAHIVHWTGPRGKAIIKEMMNNG